MAPSESSLSCPHQTKTKHPHRQYEAVPEPLSNTKKISSLKRKGKKKTHTPKSQTIKRVYSICQKKQNPESKMQERWKEKEIPGSDRHGKSWKHFSLARSRESRTGPQKPTIIFEMQASKSPEGRIERRNRFKRALNLIVGRERGSVRTLSVAYLSPVWYETKGLLTVG